MGGLGEQGKRKAEKRSSRMSEPVGEGESETPKWKRPPDEECDTDQYTLELPRSSLQNHRLKARMQQNRFTWELVEFAIVFQTRAGHRWCDVVEVDSCHDVDVHLHQYARSTQERVGSPTPLAEINSLEDVRRGYEVAISEMEQSWETYRERWHYG